MFGFLKEIITDNENSNDSKNSKLQQQIATCALFLEMANADDEFSIEEEEFITDTMKNVFNLDDNLVHELIKLAEQKTEESVSLYEFTDIINKTFSYSEKYNILKNLWRLVFADGKLDKYEEYFMRTITKNLHLEHADMIASKLEAKNESEKK